MPWLETSPVEQRERFIRDHRLELYSMVELCTRYGISRKTGYKWFDRFEDCPARFARTSRRHQRWNHPPEKAAAVHRQRAQATPHRPRGGRRRHLVHSLLQRPLGTRRRTGLHHQGVAACYPCLPVFLLPMFPVAHRLLGSRFNEHLPTEPRPTVSLPATRAHQLLRPQITNRLIKLLEQR